MQEPTLDQFDIDEKDETGRMALSFAAEIRDIKAVQRLLKKGAGLEVADKDAHMLLLWAASNRHEATVRLLRNMGTRTDTADQIYMVERPYPRQL